jgi:hypothetical protein
LVFTFCFFPPLPQKKKKGRGEKKVTIHHPTKTGENGQILVEFGAKNFRKSVKYMCAFKKIFPAKIGKICPAEFPPGGVASLC